MSAELPPSLPMDLEDKENQPTDENVDENAKAIVPTAEGEPSQGKTYQIIRQLGEGAYGSVMLVTDTQSFSIIAAMKVIDYNKHPQARKEGKKEALIHQMLSEKGRHPNVIQFIGFREDESFCRMFMEYADGGELFDRIVPGVGVGWWEAKLFFRALIDGVSFIHKQGICHRDLKPENLFVTKQDKLKIGDFGMATLFSYNGKVRTLTMQCGTRPYVSPQQYNGSYQGPPSDLWSCGVVLITLVTGQMAWEIPDEKDDEKYRMWVENSPELKTRSPFCDIEPDCNSLLRLILCVDEKKRATVEKILHHPWMSAKEKQPSPKRARRDGPSVAFASSQELPCISEGSAVPASQPASSRPHHIAPPDLPDTIETRPAFSQPARTNEMVCSEKTTQAVSQVIQGKEGWALLVRRMTRFCVNTDAALTTQRVLSVAATHGILTTVTQNNEIKGTRGSLVFIITIYTINNVEEGTFERVLVDFRRSRGDGLEFKRLFKQMQPGFSDIVCTEGNNWLESNGLTPSQMV